MLSALIPLGVGAMNLLGSAYDSSVNKKIAEKNLDLQRKNLDYQKMVQQRTWSREDNAVQRRMADLTAAGLSKTLAAGGAASAGQVVSTTAPQNQYQSRIGKDVSNSVLGALEAKNLYESIMTQKKNQSQTDAQINMLNQQLKKDQYDLEWYKKRGLPTNQSIPTVPKLIEYGKSLGEQIGNKLLPDKPKEKITVMNRFTGKPRVFKDDRRLK